MAIQNGTRNGFIDANDAKDFAGFVNYRPVRRRAEHARWRTSTSAARCWPATRTTSRSRRSCGPAIATTGNQTIGVPFLHFNNNVRESGDRTFWDLHAAWYYRQLAVISEWGSGFQDYA